MSAACILSTLLVLSTAGTIISEAAHKDEAQHFRNFEQIPFVHGTEPWPSANSNSDTHAHNGATGTVYEEPYMRRTEEDGLTDELDDSGMMWIMPLEGEVFHMHGIMVSMHLCVYACMHVCVYVCMHVCVYAWIMVSMHVCVYVCMHVCVYVRTNMHALMLVTLFEKLFSHLTRSSTCECICACCCSWNVLEITCR